MPSGQAGANEPDVATQPLLAPFARDVLLTTGRAVHVRPSTPGDIDGLRAFYDELDEDSRYLRFFSRRRFVPDDELQRATVHDVRGDVTLVAESGGVIVGVGSYAARPGDEDAEVAFAVADAHHHEGIATVLLEDLALIAQASGFRRLTAETLPVNAAMLGVFRSVGLVHRIWFEEGVVRVELDLTADDIMQDDADRRDWKAAVRSLRPILEPSHVVVIGADDATSAGGRVLAHLRATFDGRVTVVAPAAGPIDVLDGVPDLAVIAVPAPEVAAEVARCGSAGVPGAVVLSAGFAEAGPDGARLQDELLATARRHGMRLVGPNCLGVVSTARHLNATITGQPFLPGGIAIASQSGGVGVAIAAEAHRRQAGISSFVSMGNKADVSGNDLLRLWADDDTTTVVLLYLESFGDPVRFARVARAVSRRKPIVALKSGRSEPGQRGARSHTAALASDQTMVDALFAHTGVVRARTLEELIDVGLLLDLQPSPDGRRVALVGNAGGPLVLGADAADAGGLDVPMLSAALQDEIARMVPAAAATSNPVDLGAGVTPADLAQVVRATVRSGEVDACIVVGVDLGEQRHLADIGPLLDTAELRGVTVAMCLIGASGSDTGALPAYPTPERAAAAVALAARRALWLASTADDVVDAVDARLDVGSFVATRRLARTHAGDTATPSWIDAPTSLELLTTAGLPVAPWAYATSAAECAAAADGIGFPCVLKADVTDLRHKSAGGAVRLGIVDGPQAGATFDEFGRRFGGDLRGVVVQVQQPAALELLVGVIGDPAFGPLVVVGAGGVEAELRDDRVVLVAPVAAAEARRAIESLRLAPLLHGFRGRPELPVDPIVEVVQRVAMLAATVPEIRQLDMDPVLVGPDGCVAVDVAIAVASPRSAVRPVRGLRGP